eukprot:5458143-Alexandrium_andersonii.AAC.1
MPFLRGKPQLCLAGVGDPAAVRSKVARAFLSGPSGDHLVAAQQPLWRDGGCRARVDCQLHLRVAI